MSIRLIAQDLYRLQRELERLQGALEDRPPLAQRSQLEDRIRKIKAERDRMQRALEGCKDDGPRLAGSYRHTK